MAQYLYFSENTRSPTDPRTLQRIEPTHDLSFESSSHSPRQSSLGCIFTALCQFNQRAHLDIGLKTTTGPNLTSLIGERCNYSKREAVKNSNRDSYLYSYSSIATTLLDSKDGVVALTVMMLLCQGVSLPALSCVGSRKDPAVLVSIDQSLATIWGLRKNYMLTINAASCRIPNPVFPKAFF